MFAALPWSWFLVRDTALVFEWVAILLPALVGVVVIFLLIISLVFRSRAVLLVAVSVVAAGAVAVAAPWYPTPTGPPRDGVRLLAGNVLGNNQQQQAVAEDLVSAGADIVVASELSAPQQNSVADALDEHYRHRFGGDFDEVRVWSRFPLQGQKLKDLAGLNGAKVTVQAPGGTFLLYAVHVFAPSPRALGRNQITIEEQARLIRRLDAELDAATLPTVLAGDLNLTDRGAAFRRLSEGRRDAMRADWAAPTSLRLRNRPLLLRIDHVLVPAEWCAADARRITLSGSDHLGVAATIGPCS